MKKEPFIAIVLGTRPEIIKLSPVIRACIKKKVRFIIIHTGQHYSYELDGIFFKELNLPEPDYNLHVGSSPQGEQTGKMLEGIEKILISEHPDIIITLGDPNSSFAGTLAAAKLHIPVAHIEAGRRSGNRMMAEELNRLMIDQIADILFTPNETTKANLLHAGIPEERIIVSGDPITDAVAENKEIASVKSDMLCQLHLEPKKYSLATLHRPENVDSKKRLENILEAFRQLNTKYHYPVVFSVHPRTHAKILEYGLSTEGINLTEPLGYLDFLRLETDACAVLTDSGSLQEEACVLGVPCVTLRDDTERPETLEIGANVLVGADCEKIVNAVDFCPAKWENPFGGIGTSNKIIDYILEYCTVQYSTRTDNNLISL